MTDTSCMYPGCDRARAKGDGLGRPTTYCDNPDHNRKAAHRERKRRRDDEAAALQAETESRPVEIATRRAGDISAELVVIAERLLTELPVVLAHLQSAADPEAAAIEIATVRAGLQASVSDLESRLAVAQAHQRKAERYVAESDAAADDAIARNDELEAEGQALRASNDDLIHEVGGLREALAGERAETGRLRAIEERLAAQVEQLEADLARSLEELGQVRTAHVAERTARAVAETGRVAALDKAAEAIERARRAEEALAGERAKSDALTAEVGRLTAQRPGDDDGRTDGPGK